MRRGERRGAGLGASFGNSDALRQFEREARACARLVHPNVITVFDYGQIGADGAYLVMERLTGTNLRDALADGLAPAAIATLFDQMLDGVQAAHRAGIVHRDLKPENVFLADDGKGGRVVKVLDFGMAKLSEAGHLVRAFPRSGARPSRTAPTVRGGPAPGDPERRPLSWRRRAHLRPFRRRARPRSRTTHAIDAIA